MSDPFAPLAVESVCIQPVPREAPESPRRHPELGLPVKRWSYTDAAGVPCFQVWRFRAANGGKEFRPLSLWRDTTGRMEWKWRAPPSPRHLYGVNVLAHRPQAPVLVVEGEKCADAAGALLPDHVAVTSANGASGARQSDWSVLRGRDVVIWPDHNEAGQAYAREVAGLLAGVAMRVRVVLLGSAFPEDWDLGDHGDAMRAQPLVADAALFAQMVAGAPTSPLCPSLRSGISPASGRGNQGITGAALQGKVFAPIKWIVPDYFVEGLTLLAGKPKLGKSWLALNLATAVAAGGAAFGVAGCEAGDVLALTLEDNERRLQSRLLQMMGERAWPGRVTFHTGWPKLDVGGAEDIESWIGTADKPRLVIVDVWTKVRGRPDGKKTQYADDFDTLAVLQQIALKHCIAIVVLHHASKRDNPEDPFDLVSGTTGLTGAADSVMILRKEAGQADAILYGRGRDLPVFEKAMRFDETRGLWSVLGDAEAYRLSTVEAKVERVLKGASAPLSPKEVSEMLDVKAATVKTALSRMARAGNIKNLGRKYAL